MYVCWTLSGAMHGHSVPRTDDHHGYSCYYLYLDLVPSLFIARGKESDLVKRVFNFGSVRAPRSQLAWLAQIYIDCRTVLTSRALFEKDCDANLKGPRESQSIGHSASDR